MATITKKQLEEYERLRRDRDNGRVLTPDGLRIICAAYENDPEKIGIHMLEMLVLAVEIAEGLGGLVVFLGIGERFKDDGF